MSLLHAQKPVWSKRSLAALLGLSLAATIAVAACQRPAAVLDACDEKQEWCLPCNGIEDCQLTGNACTEFVYCAHEDALISVVALGCDEAMEYAWPDASACQCVASVCRYRE